MCAAAACAAAARLASSPTLCGPYCMDAEQAERETGRQRAGYCRDCKEYLAKLTGRQTSGGLRNKKWLERCSEHMQDVEELLEPRLGHWANADRPPALPRARRAPLFVPLVRVTPR